MPAYGLTQSDLRSFTETGVYPHDIRTGTGSGPLPNGDGMPMYRWAKFGRWSLKYWPDGGGAQGFVLVTGIGWVVDVDDEMPHEIWIAMLRAVDSPVIA